MKWIKIDVANKRYSIFLALSYITLFFVSITCLFMIMFNWFFQYLQKEIYNMSIVQLNNTSSIVNNQFDDYRTVLQNMFQEPSIKTSLYSKESDPINEWNISRYLNYTIINDGCIDYCAIYQNGSIKQIIGMVYPNDEEQEKLVKYLENSHNDKEIFYLKNDSNSQSRFFLFRMERDVVGETPQRGMLFAINQKKLSDKLLDNRDERNGYYIFDKEGNRILSQGLSEEGLLKKVWDNIKDEENSSYVNEINTDYGTYFMVATYDPAYELKFVQFMDISDTNTALQEGLKVALISLAVIIILCSFLATMVTYFVYRPLKQFFGKLTSYTDLVEESKEYSDQLTQITSERIISQISSISRYFHTDKVLGYLEDEPNNAVPPSILRISEHKEDVVLIYVRSKIGQISQEQYTTLFTYMKEVLQDISSVEMFPEEKGRYCLFLLLGKTGVNPILMQREQLLHNLKEYLRPIKETDGSIYLIVSEIIRQEEKLQSSFRFIQNVSKYVLFDGCEFVCDSNDFTEKLNDDVPKKEFQQIFDIVKKGDDVEAKRLTVILLKEIEKYEIKKIFHALSYFSTELEAINSQISSKTKKYQEIYMNHYIKLTSLINQKQLYDYLSSIIEDICLEIRTAGEGSLRSNMIDSIQYINEHYQDPSLSLEQVAEVFHISTSYYSRMFNEISDLTFPEYVNDLRLNYATTLLKNTKSNINDISSQAGFSNVSYFSSQFKRKYAVSPSVYRNTYSSKS